MSDLYLVIGGAVADPRRCEFEDIGKIEVVGLFRSHDDAVAAWRSAAQRTVDDATIKYLVADLRRAMPGAAAFD